MDTKSKRGGYRPGAGRPKGRLNKRTLASIAAARAIEPTDDPKDFLVALMWCEGVAMPIRAKAARALLPYTN